MSIETNNRRRFLRQTATAAAGLLLAPELIAAPAMITRYGKPDSRIRGVQIGTITYSFRSMPDQSAEATLGYVTDAGISAIELMGGPAETFAGAPAAPVSMGRIWRLLRKQRDGELSEEETTRLADLRAQMAEHGRRMAEWRASVPMDKFEQLRRMYADAGVTIYAYKPRAFEKDNTDAEIDYGLRAAKALGASHVTLEHPSDDAHTAKLGRMAERVGVKVAYHGHEQQTPNFWDAALKQSPANALNLDAGHYVAAGYDPTELLRSHHASVASMHLKDRKSPANGKDNVVWGSGDTPIEPILRQMHAGDYTFPATIELEYEIPEGSDAVAEVRRCLEYCRKALT